MIQKLKKDKIRESLQTSLMQYNWLIPGQLLRMTSTIYQEIFLRVFFIFNK